MNANFIFFEGSGWKALLKMSELQENVSPVNQAATTLDEDLKRIRDAKYDVGLETDVCKWIGQIIGRTKPAGEPAASWMKSGDILCTLMNTIRPGTIKKYNANTTSKFKQMENVTLFLRACREVGMLEKDLFSTIDLFEAKDMNSVILSLFNLGGTIQSTLPYFKGPKLGIKQNRNFPIVPQLEAPPPPAPIVAPITDPVPIVIERSPVEPAPLPLSELPELQQPVAAMMSPAAAISMATLIKPLPPVEAVMAPPLRIPEVVATVLSPPMRPVTNIQATVLSIPSLPQPSSPTAAGRPVSPKPILLPRDPQSPLANRQTIASSKPPAPPAQIEMDLKPRRRNPLSSKQIISSTRTASLEQNVNAPAGSSMHGMFPQPAPGGRQMVFIPQVAMPSMPMHPAAMGSYQSYGSNLLRQVSVMQAPMQGMQGMQTIQAPMQGMQGIQAVQATGPARIHIFAEDESPAAQARAALEWVEAVLNYRKPQSVSAPQWLASGEVLCRLATVVLAASPNQSIRVGPLGGPRDNAKQFIRVCRLLGVSESDLLHPTDLADGLGFSRVVNCVICMGGILQNYEWWAKSQQPLIGKRLRIQTIVKV